MKNFAVPSTKFGKNRPIVYNITHSALHIKYGLYFLYFAHYYSKFWHIHMTMEFVLLQSFLMDKNRYTKKLLELTKKCDGSI